MLFDGNSADNFDSSDDRIVMVLLAELPQAVSTKVDEATLAVLAALVLRTMRDDLALAVQNEDLPPHPEVEHELNDRIAELQPLEETFTGDTTLACWPGFDLALS